MEEMSNLPKSVVAAPIVQFCEKHDRYEWNVKLLMEYYTFLDTLHICSKN